MFGKLTGSSGAASVPDANVLQHVVIDRVELLLDQEGKVFILIRNQAIQGHWLPNNVSRSVPDYLKSYCYLSGFGEAAVHPGVNWPRGHTHG